MLGAWNTVQIERALSIYLQLFRDIRYSLSPRYELELAFSRLCWLGSYVSGAEVKKAIDAAQALLSGAPQSIQKPVQQAVQESVPQQPVSQPVEPAVQQTPVQPKSEEALGINPIPNGLPRLSMLDSLIEEEAKEDEPSGGENANPFHDGGPLPPKKSVAMDIPLSSTGYSENPDIEEGEDGWSNMDAPPDDEYYPDEGELADNAEAAYENAASVSAPSGAPVQLQESFVAANGKAFSIAQLRGQVTATLAVSDGFAASNLEKTGLWVVESDCVNTTVENPYDLSLIEKKKDVIAAELSNACGCQMKFNVTLKAAEPEPEVQKVEVPLQVNILVNAFKGTIVAGRM